MDRKELLAVIEEAKWSKTAFLDLSSSHIEELPEEIGQLTNLTSLNLSYNQLTVLPHTIGRLTQLTQIDLQHNQLATLPDEIEGLTNLIVLRLWGNKLQMLPQSSDQLTNLVYLDLSFNELTASPEAISKLTNLLFLGICGNKITELPEWIGQLTNLKHLDIRFNNLTALPDEIGRLINLTSFDIKHNDIQSLPQSICKLTKLFSLDLRCNQLQTLPETIGELTSLATIGLWGNKIQSLPESICKLINLNSLELGSNQFQRLAESEFDQLLKTIESLPNLKALDFSGNRVGDTPNSRFTRLIKSIKKMNNLATLNLRNSNIKDLPEDIWRLYNLTSLDLSNNQITALSESISQLQQIRDLRLSNNKLTTLPLGLTQLTRLERLNLGSNNLVIPPEITRKYTQPNLLQDFLRQLEEGSDNIYEAKLLIIGKGGAGKTSLANKLIDSNYVLKVEGSKDPEKSTEGIDVLRLDFPHPSGNTFRINIWDFGGQEIYHATHQFFLTKRSLYLLIADTRQDNTDFNYWLEIVELLTESSPTLIIKNEKQERPCEVNENQLRGRFPNLEKILPTNLLTNRGLPEILTAVQHHISQLPHIGTPLPKTWVNVRKALETDPRNHIPQPEFLTLCDTHGFKRHADKLQLSGYLHDLGVCLHFQADDLLQRTIILKPEWGTTAVYKVLDTPKVRQAFGHFTSDDLKTIWADEQYAEMRPELLQLMKNFKLCYEIPHKPKTYIAPQLLSANQPKYDWDDTENLILRYEYDFMPKGMLTRFIVEMHRLIDRELVWKEGVILTQDNSRAEVIEAYYKKAIRIRISGKTKKPLLEAIRHEFRKIHDSYEKLRYQEFIPCNCATCKGSQTPHAYALQRLQERLRNDRHKIECDISYQMVNVRGLIDDAIGSHPRDRDNDRAPNIYHSGDIVYGDKVGKDKVAGDKTEHP